MTIRLTFSERDAILANGCSEVHKVSRVRIRFGINVRVRDGYHEGWWRAVPKLIWEELVAKLLLLFNYC